MDCKECSPSLRASNDVGNIDINRLLVTSDTSDSDRLLGLEMILGYLLVLLGTHTSQSKWLLTV